MVEPSTELQRLAITGPREKDLKFVQTVKDRKWLNDRMADGNMGRLNSILTRESDMERTYADRTNHEAEVNEMAKKEMNMALEMKQVREEEKKQLLQRQFLRERDPGLRELVRKLKNGYTNRDLQAQIKYNENRRLQEKADDDKDEQILQDALNIHGSDEAARLARKDAFRRDMQQQLVTWQQKRQCQFEDTLIEKKMIEDVMAAMHREDVRERDEKRAQREKLQKEMQQTATARAAWRDIQRRIVTNEEVELEHQRSQLRDREAVVIAARNAKVKAKADIADRTWAKLQADEAEKKARNKILKALEEQEAIEKTINEEMADREKMSRAKLETLHVLQTQIHDNVRLAQKEKAQDIALRRENDEYQRAQNEKELNKQRKLRENRQQYAASLRQQIADNVQKKEREQARENATVQVMKQYQRDWDKKVREEKEKILKEHAPVVLGYLQAGVLNREDIPLVKAGAKKYPQLAQLDLAALDKKRELNRFDKCNPQCKVLREY